MIIVAFTEAVGVVVVNFLILPTSLFAYVLLELRARSWINDKKHAPIVYYEESDR